MGPLKYTSFFKVMSLKILENDGPGTIMDPVDIISCSIGHDFFSLMGP